MLCSKFGRVEDRPKVSELAAGGWLCAHPEAKVDYCVLEIPSSPLEEYCIHCLEDVGFAGILYAAAKEPNTGWAVLHSFIPHCCVGRGTRWLCGVLSGFFLSHSVSDSGSVSLSHQGLRFPGERLLAEI